MGPLDQSLAAVVGAKASKLLASSLDVHTVGDLLRHYPRRYDKRGELTKLSGLEVGEHVTVMARVLKTSKIPMRQRKGTVLKVVVTDGTGQLELAFLARAAGTAGTCSRDGRACSPAPSPSSTGPVS